MDTPLELPDPAQVATLLSTWADANPTLAAALQKGTSAAEILGRLGIRFCKNNQLAEAVEAFRAAAALEPANPSFWVNLAVALDRLGEFNRAARCLEYALHISDQQPTAWLLLGTLRSKLLDLPGTEAAYVQALRLDGESSLAWHCLGLVKQERGELADAIDCFAACVARGGASAAVLANLAKLYYQIGRFKESIDAYTGALELEPGNETYMQMLRRAQFLLALCTGPADAAIAAYQRALPADAPAEDTNLHALLQNAFTMLSGFGHRAAALRVGKAWVDLIPASASAHYLVNAMNGNAELERSPTDYIVEYFDNFADGFDEKLVKVLRYDLPGQLCAALTQVAAPGRHFDTLDIGCGTGLCGPLLKPIARTLTGVDLAPKMLDRARMRAVYDTLSCEDLLTFLERVPGQFDLVVAADVFNYFGDLRPVLLAAGNALRPGGLLAFSTETLADAGYRLQSSGRFAHNLEYVRTTAAEAFAERAHAEIILREEATVPVHGNLFVLARRDRPF